MPENTEDHNIFKGSKIPKEMRCNLVSTIHRFRDSENIILNLVPFSVVAQLEVSDLTSYINNSVFLDSEGKIPSEGIE